MDKLKKEVDILIKEQEFKSTPYIIPGLGKREWPGFKSVGSVFFVDINVKNKIIYFYLDCEFKIKPYFRFDQVLLLKYIDKRAMYNYCFDISNMIPFYYISFNNFTTTTIKAYMRNRKIRELQERVDKSQIFKLEKQITMYENNLECTLVNRIFEELICFSKFGIKKNIRIWKSKKGFLKKKKI
jgi:hypothetical protein